MARLFGSKDSAQARREYHKTSEHWERPGLADMIQDQLASGALDYDVLHAWAVAQGYADTTFKQVLSDLKSQGLVEKRDGVLSASEYAGEDWV